MAKNDTASGLLSKLVKFVRNPVTNWAELGLVDAKGDLVDKQLLKAMVERKRRNDFVREREFDMLRKLHKQEAMAELIQEPDDKLSFFHSSLASQADDRASTLKKIDEIETQMSMQWWKSKNNAAAGIVKEPLAHDPKEPGHELSTDSLLPVAYRPTVSADIDSVVPAAALASYSILSDLLESLPQRPVKTEPPARDGVVQGTGFPTVLDASLVFKPMPAPSQDIAVHGVELEEAAILFANGDDAGAEARLLEILAPGALRANHVYLWLALFDLYRATGEQEKFETAAIDFAERFQRSAPQWFSLPDLLKKLAKPSDAENQPTAAAWVCPSVLGLQTVAALNAATARTAMPWRLDWRNLKTIEAAAVEPLHKVFSSWANQPVQLAFMGDAQLQKVLLSTTPSGERATDQKWWLLRLQLLRVIRCFDDFENAALDFCVTYEVSPPAWEKARCDYKSLDAQGKAPKGTTNIEHLSSKPLHSNLHFMETNADANSDFVQSTQASHIISLELTGQIQGDAAAVLDTMETGFAGADIMQISCARLIRIDFAAAGMVLNWVSAREAENRSVEFLEVNRLVAAFFNVVGITEYASVATRTD
jgi:ABC-type transporter Mla MlaB component